MDAWSRLCGAVAIAAVLAVTAGCTPSSVPTETSVPVATPTPTPPQTATPSPTVTPTATWSAEQAAAIEALTKFGAADDKIGADPSAFTEKQVRELLQPFGGGEALESTIRWHLSLKGNGYHFTGEMVVLSTAATKAVDDGRGLEVHITRCQDQRRGRVVDSDGNPVGGDDFQIPGYNLRQFSVRKPPGEDAFRVFGYETINGACP